MIIELINDTLHCSCTIDTTTYHLLSTSAAATQHPQTTTQHNTISSTHQWPILLTTCTLYIENQEGTGRRGRGGVTPHRPKMWYNFFNVFKTSENVFVHNKITTHTLIILFYIIYVCIDVGTQVAKQVMLVGLHVCTYITSLPTCVPTYREWVRIRNFMRDGTNHETGEHLRRI